MRHWICGLFLLLSGLGAGRPATAQTLDRLLSQGYSVVLTTNVSGPFSGCQKSASLPLDNGMTFFCSQTVQIAATNPRIILLHGPFLQDYVLLAGDRILSGTIQLSTVDAALPVKRDVQDDPLKDLPIPDRFSDQLPPINSVLPVESINKIRQGDGLLLNTAETLDTPNHRERGSRAVSVPHSGTIAVPHSVIP
jgi:hypothetical protein